MATLANLAVNITANTAQYNKGLNKAESRTKKFRMGIGSLVTTLAGPVTLGAFAIFAKRALDSMDTLAKTADKIGITITKLQELRYVADRAGVAQQSLDTSLERFTKRMGEAADGTGEARKVFERFGIGLMDVNGDMRDTGAVFQDVMRGIASIESPAERAALAAKVFGREGVAMVNMIKEGIAPMEELQQRAHDLGIVLDEELFRNAEKVKDAITDVSYVLKSVFYKALAAIGEVIWSVIKALKSFADAIGLTAYIELLIQQFKDWWEVIKYLVDIFNQHIIPAIIQLRDWIVDLAVKIRDWFIATVQKIFPVTGKWIGWIKKLGKWFKWLFKPINLIRVIIIGLKMVFFSLLFGVGKTITGIANLWEWLKGIISKGMAAIRGAMYTILIGIMNLLGDTIALLRENAAALGLSSEALDKLQVKIYGVISALKIQSRESANAVYQAQRYTDIYGLQAYATEGLTDSVRELNKIRKESAKIEPIVAEEVIAPVAVAPRRGVGGAEGVGGAGALVAEGEWPLGGPFGEAGPEVWLQETGIALGALETAWTDHYANLQIMQEEHLRSLYDRQRESELVEFENRTAFLQSQVASELESAQAIESLRQDSFDEMTGALVDGMNDYMGALVKGQNGMRALKGMMITLAADTIAGIAEKWGRFYFLEGAVKLAASIYPPNPVQAAAGAAEMAAGGALMALGAAVRSVAIPPAAGAGAGAEAGAGIEPAAATPFGEPGVAEEAGVGGVIVNVHVEGHIVDTQKFVEEVVAPNLAEAVGRGIAGAAQYNLITTRD